MYTQCPKCLTYFQVTAEHLKVAQGNVRCGQCSNVFSALGNLSESPPQQTSTEKSATNNSGSNRPAAASTATNQARPSPRAASPANGNPQSKLTNAIAAIQALNQSSQQILSQGRKNYVTQLQKQAQAQRKPTAPNTGGSTARNLQQEELEASSPQANPDFDIEEALAAVDDIDVDDDITPAVDASDLVEDYKNKDTTKPSQSKKRGKYLKSDDIQVEEEEDVFDFSEMDIPEEAQPKSSKSSQPQKAKNKKPDKRKKKSAKKTTGKPKKPEQAAVEQQPEEEVEVVSPIPAEEQFVETTQNVISDPDVIIENNIPTLAIPKALLEDFEQEKASHVNYRSMLTWGGMSVAMMLVFLGQTIYFKHNELGQISSLRPWVEMFCKHASCELSLQTDINQIELLGQDIRTHPKSKKALLVSATIINNASFTQPFPGLQLSFSDINGIKVATRNFMPKDYLPSKYSSKKGMESNIPIQLELELVDPGKNAVNFEFDFFSI